MFILVSFFHVTHSTNVVSVPTPDRSQFLAGLEWGTKEARLHSS